jgi:hypothetical protein
MPGRLGRVRSPAVIIGRMGGWEAFVSTLTEQIPAVITYLLGQASENTSLGAATPPVVILDGPPPTKDLLALNPGGLTQRLWIGAEGVAPAGEPVDAASSSQGFSFLDNARTRDDQIEIMCAAEAGSGDGVMSEARAGAFAVMAAVELILRGSPGTSPASPGDASMGGLVYWAEVTGPITLQQGQLQNGAWALVRFRVSAFTRLTTN